jgi:hypothetical protein
MFAVFVDFKKAFDSVDRHKLIKEIINFNTMLIELIKMYCVLLEPNTVQIHDGLSLSNPFKQFNWVLQGDPYTYYIIQGDPYIHILCIVQLHFALILTCIYFVYL